MSLITPAVPGDLPQVLTLLQWCGLPQEGLDTLLPTIIVAREAERVVGCAALEVYETVALLRSVATGTWKATGPACTLRCAQLWGEVGVSSDRNRWGLLSSLWFSYYRARSGVFGHSSIC